jgi:hypothetical protein
MYLRKRTLRYQIILKMMMMDAAAAADDDDDNILSLDRYQ